MDNATVPMDGEEKGPGKQLREARHVRGLTIVEVAARLRLSPAMICDLEAEEYDRLPGAGFIRGYLGAYARLLKIAPAPILDAFDHHNLALPTLTRDVFNQSRMRANHLPMRIATYLIVLTLFTLVFSWWRATIHPDDYAEYKEFDALLARSGNPRQPNREPPREGTEIASHSAVAPSPEGFSPPLMEEEKATDLFPRALIDLDHNDAIITSVSPKAENPPEPAPVANTPVVSIASEEGMHLATSEAPPPEAMPLQTIIPEAAAPKAVIPEAVSDVIAPPSVAAPKPDHLTIHLEKDCWIEVYDESGKRLYYAFGLSGQTYEFQGASPFRVMLGYAHAAEVIYNGKPFDHTPYIEKDVAKFSVGDSHYGEFNGVVPLSDRIISKP